MKKIILFLSLFIFTFSINSFGTMGTLHQNGTFGNAISKTNITLKLTIQQVMDLGIDGLQKLINSKIEKNADICEITVTVSGEVDIKGVGKVTVEVSVTAACSEAQSIATSVYKAVVKMLRQL